MGPLDRGVADRVLAGILRVEVMNLARTTRYARDAVLDRARGADSVSELFGAASRPLRRLVPFDAAVWLAADPATSLPAAPSLAESMLHRSKLDRELVLRVWEGEFMDEDVNAYSTLALADVPAGGLRIATRDRPTRSSRYREVLKDKGFGDELRAVLRVDGNPWAMISLFRDEGRPAFEETEIDLVASLSQPLADAVRQLARPSQLSPVADSAPGPGLMLFAPHGELISINDDALAWLDDVPSELVERAGFETRLPMFVVATLMRARAIAEQRDHGPARVRMRSRRGRWLTCHATCLRDAGGKIRETALVIEPASGTEIAPIIVRAYELSAREDQITQLIARGHNTAEIAARLCLSAHTVRDYIKAVFEKVGVSSRGELVAKLFAEHYAANHLDPSNHTFLGE